jgi:uncharacterized repeat protein (TIGR03803 family)
MSVVARFSGWLSLASALALTTAAAHATEFRTLHSFYYPNEGGVPFTGLLSENGALYGTTSGGGSGCPGAFSTVCAGTVFRFDPAARKLTILYAFPFIIAGKPQYPYGSMPAGLAFPGSTLYGTTFNGGQYGGGTVFEVDPATGKLTTLHAFGGGADGEYPEPLAALVFVKGVLYGTTSQGGQYGDGTIFEIDPTTKKLTVVHAFSGTADGAMPAAGLLFENGVLYGTTYQGGYGDGTIFELDPDTRKLTTLYRFTGDGAYSDGGLTYKFGLLYGSTTEGGTGFGNLFAFNPKTKKLTTLYTFTGLADGGYPLGALVFDASGMLYGTTSEDGKGHSGTAFKFDPTTGKLTTLHTFTGGADGGNPPAGLVLEHGTLYGTTTMGGMSSGGTIFAVAP